MSQPPNPPQGGSDPQGRWPREQGRGPVEQGRGPADEPTERLGGRAPDQPTDRLGGSGQQAPPGQDRQPTEPFGPAPFAQPPYGQPPYGPPQYGPPQYGPPPYAGYPYGQFPYGPPPYGPPPYGQPQYGPPAYGPPGPGRPPGRGPGRGKVLALVAAAVLLLAAVGVGVLLVVRGSGDGGGALPQTTSPSPSSPSGGPDDVPAGQPPGDLGDDPAFDALAERCFEEDWAACDDLYFRTPVNSAYEEYGTTCGQRNEPVFGGCAERYAGGGAGGGGGDPDDVPAAEPAPTGGPAELQTLADRCEEGRMIFCDLLRLAALPDPALAEYGDYAATCGGRTEPVDSCVARYGN